MTVEAVIEIVRGMSLHDRARLMSVIAEMFTQVYDEESSKTHDIMEFAGVGADMYKGIDTTQMLNDLRDEWDAPREN